MGEKTERIITTLFYIVIFSVLASLFLQNLSNPWMLLLLSGFLLASFTFRNAVIYGSRERRSLGKILFLFDIALIFLISHFDKSSSSLLYYFVIIGDACIAYSFSFGSVVTAACFMASTTERILRAEQLSSDFVSGIVFNLLAFLSIDAILYIIKYEMGQREKLGSTMYELKIKTKQLENTFIKLKETSEELEEVTALKERNRIAREIHDTVGHTLTTVLLEMEAGERLLSTNQQLALEKLSLAKGQVRKGLNDIRESVSTLQTGKDILDFIPSLNLLISEITKHGDIYVRSDISELPELDAAPKKALYRALQEGLTNGIKHGESTAFVFILKYANNCVKFLLQDNGKGTDKIVRGFGLTSMNERVMELGGLFTADSKPGEGFNIDISIPVEKENPPNGSN